MEHDQDEWKGPDRRKPDKWHVGKEIPIALIATLFLQTGGGIWWASATSAKLDYAIARLDEFSRERYTREDARRDRELFIQRDAEHDRRLAEVEAIMKNGRRDR